MKKIIYYVASSLDGFIAGKDDDVNMFLFKGNGVDKYLEDLKEFKTVVMGRRTYEFGYKFGAVPGQPSPAYPHMKHYIFSNDLKLDNLHKNVQIKSLNVKEVIKIKESSDSDIYLCGGGQLAKWFLENGLIDLLKIKLNPITLGSGIPLFGGTEIAKRWNLIKTETFEHGLLMLTYEISQ
jgi:dihydrofolate reductase